MIGDLSHALTWVSQPHTARVEENRLVVELALAPIDVEACYPYVLGRQTGHGGFCFYRHAEWGVEEPNAPDTWAALEVAAKLNRQVPKPLKCVTWLGAQQDRFGRYWTLLIGYAALMALRRLHAEPERDPKPFILEWSERLQLAAGNPRCGQGWLSGAQRCMELRLVYDIAVTATVQRTISKALTSLRGSAGGYGSPGANLPDTALALTLSSIAGLPVPPECLIYARQCEQPPDGFNVMSHGSSSSLECQHAGLRILHHFGQRPRDSARIRDFVVACQSSAGGFGRVPGAIPRLDETLRAVEILCMLDIDSQVD